MTKLGGWLISPFRLDDDEEELVVRYPANLFVGDARPLGGRLYLTDRRAIFLPHRIDAALGGTSTVMPYEEIVSVTLETAEDREQDSGDLPDRVQIEMDDGTILLYVVSDPQKALARLERGVAAGELDPSDSQ